MPPGLESGGDASRADIQILAAGSAPYSANDSSQIINLHHLTQFGDGNSNADIEINNSDKFNIMLQIMYSRVAK